MIQCRPFPLRYLLDEDNKMKVYFGAAACRFQSSNSDATTLKGNLEKQVAYVARGIPLVEKLKLHEHHHPRA